MTGGSLLAADGFISIGNEPAACKPGAQEGGGLPERQAHRDRAGGGVVGVGREGCALLCGSAGGCVRAR
ncbi:hypothetical protein D3C72_761690 [compost metagenome]